MSKSRLNLQYTFLFLFFYSCSDHPTTMQADLGLNNTSTSDALTDLSNPETACIAFQSLNICTGKECSIVECKEDEICEDAKCKRWEDAKNLSVDFTVTSDSEKRSIQVDILEGGFLRSSADAIRFDFGDGIAGWGEHLTHKYRTRANYPVVLKVRLKDGRILEKVKTATIGKDDFNPLFLSVNRIPAFLNGSQDLLLNNNTPEDDSDDYRETFTLQVPRSRFDITLGIYEKGNDLVDPSTLKLMVMHGEKAIDLSPAITFRKNGIEGEVLIRSANELPKGMLKIRFSGETKKGRKFTKELLVESVEFPSKIDPRSRPTIWLLRDDQDYFTTKKMEINKNKYLLSSENKPNGIPDFIEELGLMGAQGKSEKLNAFYLDWIRAEIDKEIYRIFGLNPKGEGVDKIPLKIFWIAQKGAPLPQTFTPEGDFSMMRLGGRFDGFLGFSEFSAFNQKRTNDSTEKLGVGTAGIISSLSSNIEVWKGFAPLNISNGGKSIGDLPADFIVLDPLYRVANEKNEELRQRYLDLKFVARNIGLALAPVIAHEMGHAMGLVPDGLPPKGFFGNRNDVDFIGSRTNVHHADFPGLVLMQAGGNSSALLGELLGSIEHEGLSLVEIAPILSLETHLSPLSRAYLEGKLTYAQ